MFRPVLNFSMEVLPWFFVVVVHVFQIFPPKFSSGSKKKVRRRRRSRRRHRSRRVRREVERRRRQLCRQTPFQVRLQRP